jgi:histone H3/H4
MTEKCLPLAAMEKIMKKNGAARVSDKAKVALKDVIEDEASKIATKAVKFALHAGRKTIKANDIKLAAKE